MSLRFFLLAGIFVFAAPGMRANTTYFYCGNPATPTADCQLQGANFIQASFTVSSPLAPNTIQSITPEAFEMGYPDNPPGPGVPTGPQVLTLDVATDANGNIADWFMQISSTTSDPTGLGSYLIETCNNPSVFGLVCQAGNAATALDYFQIKTLHNTVVMENLANDPGAWSVTSSVPEPTSFGLIGVALALSFAGISKAKRLGRPRI